MAGTVAAAAWWAHASTQVHHAVSDFARTQSPFGGSVVVAEGAHTIWIEGSCLSCAGNEPEEYRRAATVRVVGPDDRPVELSPAPARVFNIGGTEGRALWSFTATEAGEHRLQLSFDTSGDWDNRLPDRIAVGPGRGLPVRIVGPAAGFAAGGLALAGVWAAGLRVWRQRWFRLQAVSSRRSCAERPHGSRR